MLNAQNKAVALVTFSGNFQAIFKDMNLDTQHLKYDAYASEH